MGQHVVKQGECLETIAHQYGFSWQSLWAFPDNAELKQLRKDPNLLYPGDIVFLPEIKLKKLDVISEALHRFIYKGLPSKLHLQLIDNGSPLTNAAYDLVIGGELLTGSTDSNGEINIRIPVNAKQGQLTLSESGIKIILEVGYLGPIEEVAGYQARLENLGYYVGSIDGVNGEYTNQAIKQFQKDHDLEVTGDPDQQTLSKLQKIHGS
ncbi:MAG: peptidoglycan-binding protein [Gammaproteobacteria bacterium]|nr:peptidoglycan-binding protein [Gammaproteobacteria bacterium]